MPGWRVGSFLVLAGALVLEVACGSGSDDGSGGKNATGGTGANDAGNSGGSGASGGSGGSTGGAAGSGGVSSGGTSATGGSAGVGGGGTGGSGGAAGAGNTTYAHEPAGFTKITERPFDALIEDGWSFNATTNFTIEDASTLSLAGIAGPGIPPKSPNHIGQAYYAAGCCAGTSPVTVYYPNALLTALSYHRIYVSYWVQYSSNWVGNTSGVNKMVFVGLGPNGNQVVFSGTGSGSAPLLAQIRLQGLNQSPSAWNLPLIAGAQGQAEITRGAWHQLEGVFVANTGGQANGEAHLWLDGVKLSEELGVNYVPASNNGLVEKLSWDPTYGGGAPPPPADQYMWMDHFYASGAP
jgi:hypothetical protein